MLKLTSFFISLQPQIIDTKWLNEKGLKQVATNICTLIHDQPLDSLDLVECFSNLIKSVMNIQDSESKSLLFVMKKARGFFKHELKNEPQEFLRRKLYYNSILKVMKTIDFSSTLQENEKTFVNFVKKNVAKDRKQPQLEEVASEVQLLCEKFTNDE